MPLNLETTQQQIYADFEAMLDFIKESKTQTADQVERGLFKQLVALGVQLMSFFFALRAQQYPRTPLEGELGERLPFFAWKKRTYFSIFGKVMLWRPYFYKRGSGASPLDAALSLGQDSYSDLLRETLEVFSVDLAYDKTAALLERLFGYRLSSHGIQSMIAQDAGDVVSYYEQKSAPDPKTESEILVLQADGKGVPMLPEEASAKKVRLGKGQKRTKKKEAIVTGLYTIEAHKRSPEEVLESFFQHRVLAPTTGPQDKQLWATLEGKDTALARLSEQVSRRDGAHILHRVALTDGCEALQSRVRDRFPDFTLILDFVHATEYLWKVANSLFSEQDPERQVWVESKTLLMLSGQTEEMITDLRQRAKLARKAVASVLEKTANYFARNRGYMHYHLYLARGWPIASGVIEGACRHLVKDRFERSGMRWRKAGAESLLGLRSVAENGDWETYHSFRRGRRHGRLYGESYPDGDVIEVQALDQHALKVSPIGSAQSRRPKQLKRAA